ncbi:TetR/AcrR family transcriptional regulator [Pedobacter gandavensis]|uniref:TetR family transcriptional regulator n=1 Tax=Pedobacter gandavensis TaxID=2679963 RepID=A0ABR6EQA0_9SPHI|nr:TetR/AcrR family transcriptional regulator [Pedobacter gandavensis]MBB2147415.1 TetR family transcriptional regulator [Pedobacter gandavensis]
MSKKQDILAAALRLFTKNGVRATSTKSIAEEANTSEALIFRHFKTKDNLLEGIIRNGYKEALTLTTTFLEHKEPKAFLIQMIDLPQTLVDSNFDFWRMQYKILPLNSIAQHYHNSFMKPSGDKLAEVFRLLGYEYPVEESDVLILLIDGIWKSYASDRFTNERCNSLEKLLKIKYDLN